ncbi:MAG: mechanosensitive ion channel [Lachnospiraceae bacterium]|nr:mechanosensitive ion channel [Lachnospiraceae bacterium]MBQ9936107.1 mechanosensitive ion channel [Lachnospiraceae bacterium]
MILSDINSLEDVKNLDKSKLEQYGDQFLDWLADKTFDIVVALIFLFVGMKVAKLLVKVIKRAFEKSAMEDSVEGFLLSVIKGILYAIVFVMAISIVGVQVTSLVAILGTASLSIGLALQGSLANFAGGVLILLMKPFKVGDYIIENDKGCEGTVEAIDIFYTKLKTYDNKIIVIPNGNITANSLVNVTAEASRKLDISVGVSYDSDIKLVKDTLTAIVQASPYYDKTKEMNIFVDSFQESSIKMGIRCFVKTEDYWAAKWEITENIKVKFDENNIVIPFSQVEVTVKNS